MKRAALATLIRKLGPVEIVRRLRELGVDVAESTPRWWASGKRRPKVDARLALEQIALHVESAKKETTTPLASTARERLMSHLEVIQALIDRAASDGTPPAKIASLANAYTSAERMLTRVSGELVITEAQIVRSPAFRRVMQAVLEAVAPFPGAARAVADKLEQLGKDDVA